MTGAGAGLHLVVTGSSGFVGRALVARLLADSAVGGRPIACLTLLDVLSGAPTGDGIVRPLDLNIADPAAAARAFDTPVDVLVHLASIPGGTAEQDYGLARDVNLRGTLHLLEACKSQVERGGPVPRVVFASSIAVYGSALPARVDDDTPACPAMTYGAHKLMGEVAVADFSRRGWCDGLSLRLPGVLARPPARTGQLSAFLSDLMRDPAQGRVVTCPMSPSATTWASSTPNVVGNLLHAVTVDTANLRPQRALALPTLHFSMADLVDALAAVHGPAVRDCVHFAPEPRIESLFGRFPPLCTPAADAAGFRHDGDLPALCRRAIEP